MADSLDEPLLSPFDFYRGAQLIDHAYDDWTWRDLTISAWQALIDKQYRFTEAELKILNFDWFYFEDRDGDQHDFRFKFEGDYESIEEAYARAFEDLVEAHEEIKKSFEYVALFASPQSRKQFIANSKNRRPGRILNPDQFHHLIGAIGFFLRNKLSYEKSERELLEVKNKPFATADWQAYIEYRTAELSRFDELLNLKTETDEEELKKAAFISNGRTLIAYLDNLLEMFNKLESSIRSVASKDEYFKEANWLDKEVISLANECVLVKRIVYEMYEYDKLHNFVESNIEVVQRCLFK